MNLIEKLDCDKCSFRKQCIYSQIKNPKTKRIWNTNKRSCINHDGDIIFQEGDYPENFMLVCKGRVKLYKTTPSGEQVITAIKYPGNMFGYSCVCREDRFILNAKAMGEIYISFFPKKFFIEMLRNDFDFCYAIMKIFCMDIGNLQTKIASMAYQTAEEKIAGILLNHISFSTKNTPTPTIYGLKRTEIAEISGLRIETVVRTLARFEKKKIIKRERDSIKILDMDKLLEINKYIDKESH